MKEFKLNALCTISITTKIKANTLEEAISKARQRQDILHSHYEHGDESEHWVADDYDGMPFCIQLCEE